MYYFVRNLKSAYLIIKHKLLKFVATLTLVPDVQSPFCCLDYNTNQCFVKFYLLDSKTLFYQHFSDRQTHACTYFSADGQLASNFIHR